LLIGAFIPRTEVMKVFNLQGLVLFALYMAGIFSAMLVSYVIKKTRKDKSEHALLMELPRYRWPNPRDIAMGLWERTIIFMRRVTGIILSLTVILWFLSSYPAPPDGATLPAIQLANLYRVDSRPRRARSCRCRACHRVCHFRWR
jgi:ferrous iron transport protein B